ncbi:MAG TPA: cupin domain-containing protein, partial [Gaiellales bacterium]|nr:cupin domain-containing protein [Gaiellales bacterium]
LTAGRGDLTITRAMCSLIARVPPGASRSITRMLTVLAVMAAASLFGCGSSSQAVSANASAHGEQVKGLAGGVVDALPSGNLFLRVIGFYQHPMAAFPSHKHTPGFVYVAAGVQRLHSQGEPPRLIEPGEAVFQPSVFHTHANPSATRPNRWYFIALWPTAERHAPLVSSAARVVYESADLDASTLPPGSRVETLRLVTLQPNGRSAAHRFSGLELLFMLDGTIRLDVAGQPPTNLSAGQAQYLPPGTAEQEFGAGARVARYLAFIVTPVQAPFEIAVPHSV